MNLQYLHTSPGEFFTPLTKYKIINVFSRHFQIYDDRGNPRLILKNNKLFIQCN